MSAQRGQGPFQFAGARAARWAHLLAALSAAVAVAEEPRPDFVLRPVAFITGHLYEGPLAEPTGLFFDTIANELLVVDTKSDRIGVFNAEGAPLYTFGQEVVREPVKAVTDAKGRMYVLDSDRSGIKILNYRGEPLSRLALPGFEKPPVIATLAADADGNLYVAEHTSCRIYIFDASLTLRHKFGERGAEVGQFLSIAGIAVDDSHIYVTDHQARPVQVFTRRGGFVRAWGKHEMGVENFSLPEGIAVDSAGRLVVIDALRHEVKFFDVDGRFLGRFGGIGAKAGQVTFPRDVAVDFAGRIYVSERGGGRVQVFIQEAPQKSPGGAAK